MKVYDLVQRLKGLDQNIEILAEFEDRAYSIHTAEFKFCYAGEIYDSKEEAIQCKDPKAAECIVLRTLF